MAVDGTQHNKILHRNLLPTPIELQRSPKKDLSTNKHNLRGAGGKYVNPSERTRLMEEGIVSESKPKVRKVNSHEEDSDLECYGRSKGKPENVDIDKEITEGKKPTLALLTDRSEEDKIKNTAETRDKGR